MSCIVNQVKFMKGLIMQIVEISDLLIPNDGKEKSYQVLVKHNNVMVSLSINSFGGPTTEIIELHILGAVTILEYDSVQMICDLFPKKNTKLINDYDVEEQEYAQYLLESLGDTYINKLKKKYDW